MPCHWPSVFIPAERCIKKRYTETPHLLRVRFQASASTKCHRKWIGRHPHGAALSRSRTTPTIRRFPAFHSVLVSFCFLIKKQDSFTKKPLFRPSGKRPGDTAGKNYHQVSTIRRVWVFFRRCHKTSMRIRTAPVSSIRSDGSPDVCAQSARRCGLVGDR